MKHHPAVRTGDELTRGERIADVAVKAMGSWAFIIAQALVIAAWMVLNTVALIAHWDPYPWILLNLIFSIQAAFAAPLILLSQRRSDQKNSERAEYDLKTDLAALTILQRLQEQIAELPAIIKKDNG